MKALARLGLLLGTALVLASCGGDEASSGGDQGDGMQGMNHGGSGGETAKKEEKSGGMAGMDHGSMQMGSGGAAREMVMVDGEYSDEAFIDAMVPHHQGAIDMAKVALDNAEHQEIRSLAWDIVSTQDAEIERLRSIKQREFGNSRVPIEMSPGEMKTMGMSMDPQELAGKEPFDKAFINEMIPHHESAIAMARVAREENENPDIREIAGDIVDAQKKEISQMNRWHAEWYR